MLLKGPLTRYAKLRFAHAPGMPGTFSPPLTSKETASLRSRHASRHVRHARAVMHVGITNPWWRGNVHGIPVACATHNFAYLVRGPWSSKCISSGNKSDSLRIFRNRIIHRPPVDFTRIIQGYFHSSVTFMWWTSPPSPSITCWLPLKSHYSPKEV